MNRLLLLTAAALIVTVTDAQIKRTETTQAPPRPNLQLMKPKAKMEEMQIRTPGTPAIKAPKRAQNVDVWYRRPAGAFTGIMMVEDSAYAGMAYAPRLAVKPYCDYTFMGIANGVSDDAQYYWDVQYWDEDENGNSKQVWTTVDGKNLTWKWGYESNDVPRFNVTDNGNCYWWNIRGFEVGQSDGIPIIVSDEYLGLLLSVPSTLDIWGYEYLMSSKTFCNGGRYGDQTYAMLYYRGPEPFGQNDYGWWFGKNYGKDKYRYDGIAQAFEKPEHPYLLKQVVLDCAFLDVAAPVDMHCKIYKIDEIPPYMDEGVATLPEVPGELIARGTAHLTPETYYKTSGLVFFTLYDQEDGLEFEITPTIDDAILVVIDGYNDPEMENLTDFSAMISSDIYADEGFGELAYLKVGIPDEEGNLDHYEWQGLNNFFSSGTMKTGLTIFLTTELPYLSFYYDEEDGEFIFPEEGGVMEKQLGEHTSRSIEFRSWVSSEDEGWDMSCNGEEIPDWLTIELEDQISQGEYSGVVNAVVNAESLPEGVQYREAIVRFEFPGAYIDYKFIQGIKIGPNPPPFHFKYDMNEDGEVNIADVNALIVIILAGDTDANIGHLNMLIDYILTGNDRL